MGWETIMHLVIEEVVHPDDASLIFGVMRVDHPQQLDLIQALVKVILIVLEKRKKGENPH